MPKHPVASPEVYTPGTYSQAFVVTGGRTIYVSGMTSRDKNGNVVGEGDMKKQTTLVFENMKAVLQAAGANMSDVVKINVFLTDISQIASFREVREQFFKQPMPASTVVATSALGDQRLLLEVEAIAVVD